MEKIGTSEIGIGRLPRLVGGVRAAPADWAIFAGCMVNDALRGVIQPNCLESAVNHKNAAKTLMEPPNPPSALTLF
jgi:hypothetical protein